MRSSKKAFIIFLISFILLHVSNCLMNFPRIVWLYWETNITQAPLIVKVSHERMVALGKDSNWTVNLVNKTNIKDFVNDMQGFQDAVKKGKRQTVQEKSDLLRIWLLEETGGVWIDFACIPYENLDWLTNYTSYQHMIMNRMGTNCDDPEMFMIGEGWHQSPLSYYNSDGDFVSDEYFGTAIHFIASKKKSKMMTDWKQKMKSISTMSYVEMMDEMVERRYFMHGIYVEDVYYSGNVAYEEVIQRKQFQLDKNLNLFSKRMSVYEHYKIWNIHGEVGPIGLTREHLLSAADLFFLTREQYDGLAEKPRFYLKVARYMREHIDSKRNFTIEYFAKTNKTIQQIIAIGPSHEECFLFFIVEGSVMYNFLNGSKYFSEEKTPIITVKQRDYLRSKCNNTNPKDYQSMYQISSVGQNVAPEREIYGTETSLKAKLWTWWLVNKNDIRSLDDRCHEPLTFIFILFVIKLLFGPTIKKIATKNSAIQSIQSNGSQQEIYNNQESEIQNIPNISTSKLNLYIIFTISYISVLFLVVLQVYFRIFFTGWISIYNEIAILTSLTFFIHYFTQRVTKKYHLEHSVSEWFASLRTINLLSRINLIMMIGFAILMHFDYLWEYAYRDAVLLVGMGYLLYVILYQMKRRKLVNNKVHDSVVHFVGYWLPIGLTSFTVLVAFWRIPMYLTYGDHYVRLLFIINYKVVFEWFAALTVGYIIVTMLRNINLSLKRQSTSLFNMQSTSSQSHLKQTADLQQIREESIIFIIAALCWVGTYYNSSTIYEKFTSFICWQQHHDPHNFYFKLFSMHFTLFEFALRLRVSSNLDKKYKIPLYVMSYVYPVLGAIFGFNTIFQLMFRYWQRFQRLLISYVVLICLLALIEETFDCQIEKKKKMLRNNQQFDEITRSFSFTLISSQKFLIHFSYEFFTYLININQF